MDEYKKGFKFQVFLQIQIGIQSENKSRMVNLLVIANFVNSSKYFSSKVAFTSGKSLWFGTKSRQLVHDVLALHTFFISFLRREIKTE